MRTDYIDLSKIERISRFRSSVGHDYSDSFESCRSMKHYFVPQDSAVIDWSAITIRSPVDGTVSRVLDEWAGKQVQVQASAHPAYRFNLFHVNVTVPLDVGDTVTAGQVLGSHIGTQTWSDIAVEVSTPNGMRLVSYFQVMTDALFQSYQGRGVSSRDALIISKEARDGDPLTCSGEQFTSSGTLENWVTLQ